MDIGKRIRDLREERGLTQREVARRAGLTPSGVGFIEHGQTRKPSAETVVAIARALGVPVKELLEEPVAPLGEASETGPDIARSEALRQWEQGHKAIARAIADKFGFSVADLMEEPPASLAEVPQETGQPRAGSAAEGHLTWRGTWKEYENLSPEQREELERNMDKSRTTVEIKVYRVDQAAERLRVTR
jgi:transcriptional regulator with XRE-family HTH domain